ncbi:MAG: heat-shock protein Hsp20 [Ferruginibacter sp.]|nr:heat-shock protein Hsp20 [Ferruginibacter sp.]
MNNLAKSSKQLRAYDPWRDFLNFENFFPAEFGKQSRNFPAVNISEDDKGFMVDVVAPGFKKEDFKVNVADDVLTISAETKTESSNGDGNNNNNKQFTRREYSYSSFTRSFRLPENAQDDSISANYQDGVLKLEIPKSQQQVKATKEISVN